MHFAAVSYDMPLAYMKLLPEPRDDWLCSRNWCSSDVWMIRAFAGRPPGVYARRAPQHAKASDRNVLCDVTAEFSSATQSQLRFQLFATLPEAVAWTRANRPNVASRDGAYSSLTLTHPSTVNMFARPCLKCESVFFEPSLVSSKKKIHLAGDSSLGEHVPAKLENGKRSLTWKRLDHPSFPARQTDKTPSETNDKLLEMLRTDAVAAYVWAYGWQQLGG